MSYYSRLDVLKLFSRESHNAYLWLGDPGTVVFSHWLLEIVWVFPMTGIGLVFCPEDTKHFSVDIHFKGVNLIFYSSEERFHLYIKGHKRLSNVVVWVWRPRLRLRIAKIVFMLVNVFLVCSILALVLNFISLCWLISLTRYFRENTCFIIFSCSLKNGVYFFFF